MQVNGFDHQKALTGYLHAEVLHTLGAYKVANEHLVDVRELLTETNRQHDGGSGGLKYLCNSIKVAERLNEGLRSAIDKPSSDDGHPSYRHPSPYKDESETNNYANHQLLPALLFYSKVVALIPQADENELGKLLTVIHDPVRGGAERKLSPTQRKALVNSRGERYQSRLTEVKVLYEVFKIDDSLNHVELPDRYLKSSHLGVNQSCSELSSASSEGNAEIGLHACAIEALNRSHELMHWVEHVRSASLDTKIKKLQEHDKEIDKAMGWSVALNTFAYVVARSIPWTFAQDESERDYVIENIRDCHERLAPTTCMWIGQQISMIALHRRAYSHWLKGDRDRAYRDFYKLIRLLRELRERVDHKGLRASGSRLTIEGLSTASELHIGRIYRSQHAHREAIRYFDRAKQRMKGWKDHEEIGTVLRNSRWRVNLLISQGKASYELGRMKRAIYYYVEAWRAFLELSESESRLRANFDEADTVLDWLQPLLDEPSINKYRLNERFEPLIRQFESWYGPKHLALIAADIMMRLGHLFCILGVPNINWTPDAKEAKYPAPTRYEMAVRCLEKAASLDNANTLIAADIMRIQNMYDANAIPDDERAFKNGNAVNELFENGNYKPIGEQWPQGGSPFEELARAVEYGMQHWIFAKEKAARDSESAETKRNANSGVIESQIAKGLLTSYLAHTDSSNVKLAQVYRYLMQPETKTPQTQKPFMDFICLRRYSSFFPMVPRPTAFKALGGGYFVHIYDGERYYGIAIDPGPDYIDNLYRCGYGLGDISTIIVTHDHSDHASSIDSLLTLIGYRDIVSQSGKFKRNNDPAEKSNALLIIGNESVAKRYEYFNRRCPVVKRLVRDRNGMDKALVNAGHFQQVGDRKYIPSERIDQVRVMSFKEYEAFRLSEASIQSGSSHAVNEGDEDCLLDLLEPSWYPNGLTIETVMTHDHIDAGGYPSQGFMLKYENCGETRTILFTGDTAPPERVSETVFGGQKDRSKYPTETGVLFEDGVTNSDVVVAHVSSIPAQELREFARLENAGQPTQAGIVEALWKNLATVAAAPGGSGKNSAADLLDQLQFGFRLRAKKGNDKYAATPFTSTDDLKPVSERHLMLEGLMEIARLMISEDKDPEQPEPLLIIGELREELGTFRTRIAAHINTHLFEGPQKESKQRIANALTSDIGLKVRLGFGSSTAVAGHSAGRRVSVLCTECDLDNDLVSAERYHAPEEIREVCVKGENEGVFYNCMLHDPGRHRDQPWLEAVERYDLFSA